MIRRLLLLQKNTQGRKRNEGGKGEERVNYQVIN